MANLMGVGNSNIVKHCQALCDPSQLVPDRGEEETLGSDSLMELPEEGLKTFHTLKNQEMVIICTRNGYAICVRRTCRKIELPRRRYLLA